MRANPARHTGHPKWADNRKDEGGNDEE